MSDEIDREITTKKVTSHPNTSVDGYRVSEQRTTRVNNDNSATGLILGVLLTLAVGVGAGIYFLNNRPTPTPAQILVPGATNTIRENKSTVIERNNTNTKEVKPSTPQSAPNVEINVPAPAATTPPQPLAPEPTPEPTPEATTQPQSPVPSPSPAN